jgi:hypothetical protein
VYRNVDAGVEAGRSLDHLLAIEKGDGGRARRKKFKWNRLGKTSERGLRVTLPGWTDRTGPTARHRNAWGSG